MVDGDEVAKEVRVEDQRERSNGPAISNTEREREMALTHRRCLNWRR